MAPARSLRSWCAVALAATAAAGCGSGAAPTAGGSLPALTTVSDSQWAALARTKIYFGHQSVGRNILAGVQEILEQNPQISLRIVESADPTGVVGPALVHTYLGNNGHPQVKAAEFESRLSHGLGGEGGIVMYKYCFVDFDNGTDVLAVFDTYRQGIERIRAGHPEIRVVHITVPLATNGNAFKELVRRTLGRPTYGEINAKRNRYNQLLKESYEGRDPIFDLSRIESTHADGSREFFLSRGDTVYKLAPEWTDDGGHLNGEGRKVVGQQFLIFLATVASPPNANQDEVRQ
jgi:hypothetical protein